jgi:hypothetical protein
MMIALALAAGLASSDLQAARTFVQQLYAAYHGDGPDYLGRQRAQVFSPRMIALLRRDARLTPKGDVGALDGDPICDCQDFDIRGVEVKVSSTGEHKATADVRFQNFQARQAVRIDLVESAGKWRIDDIHSKSIPDLATFLHDHAGGR